VGFETRRGHLDFGRRGNLRWAMMAAAKAPLAVEGGTFNLGNNGLYINAGRPVLAAREISICRANIDAGTVQFGDGVRPSVRAARRR